MACSYTGYVLDSWLAGNSASYSENLLVAALAFRDCMLTNGVSRSSLDLHTIRAVLCDRSYNSRTLSERGQYPYPLNEVKTSLTDGIQFTSLKISMSQPLRREPTNHPLELGYLPQGNATP